MAAPYTEAADQYDIAQRNKDYRTESALIVDLVHRRMPTARTLLDVGCGTGRHLQHLADHFDTAGVDASGEMLAIAADRLEGVPLHRGDIRTFALDRTFDVVTCLFSSIGYLRPEIEMRRAVANLSRHVATGGLLIIEPWVSPDSWHRDDVHIDTVERDGWVQMTSARRRGTTTFLDIHQLVSSPTGITHRSERHVLELYTSRQYRLAMEWVGMDVEHDPTGLTGRGLFIGRSTAER